MAESASPSPKAVTRVNSTSATATAGSVVWARPAVDIVLSAPPGAFRVWSLDAFDLLFVGGFVAAVCLGIAGLVTLVAPPGVPGFADALAGVFLLFGLAFFLLGVLGAALLTVLDG